MATETIVDIYCHIFPDAFFQEMNRIAPRLGNIGARLRSVKKLFDLDERFREMDQFGDYREIISLPNPPIEDLAAGEVGLNLARIGNDAMAELCARHPARFPTFVAALSMTDVEGSVKEARRAVNELGAGRFQMPFATQAVMMGGNVRVGLEDSLYIGRGKLAKSNAEQVAKARRLIEELGYQVATPKEAREILALKGADRTKF